MFFWCIFVYIFEGQLLNPIDEALSGLLGVGGVLPVAWFLFMWFLLLLFSCVLCHLKQIRKTLFCLFTVIWLILLAIPNLSLFDYFAVKTQSLWLHMYVPYFMLGMMVSEIKVEKRKYRCIWNCIAIVSFIYYMLSVRSAEVYQLPAGYYGKWYYTIWLIAMFILIKDIDIGNKAGKILKRLSADTFSVYMLHLPILLIISKYYLIDSIGKGVLITIVLFGICEILAELFRKIPLLRKMV